MSAVWLVTPHILLATLPVAFYAFVHILTFLRSEVLEASSSTYRNIGLFIRAYYDSIMKLVACLEVVLWSRTLASVFFGQKDSWIQLVACSYSIRLRYEKNASSKEIMKTWVMILDRIFGENMVWRCLKDCTTQVFVITDLSSYLLYAADSTGINHEHEE